MMKQAWKVCASACLASVLICGSSAVAGPRQAPASPSVIQIPIHNAQGQQIGSAKLTQLPDGVKINVSVTGLAPGQHGIHFHENGICEGPSFESAGAHFNPTGRHHGLNNPEGPHAGDLPNLQADGQGSANVEWISKAVTLEPGKPNSLLKPGGTALIIHENPDDQVSDPSGNSGARIACGAIRQ
jgi:Cu-Zn family superoxide dismutase